MKKTRKMDSSSGVWGQWDIDFAWKEDTTITEITGLSNCFQSARLTFITSIFRDLKSTALASCLEDKM